MLGAIRNKSKGWVAYLIVGLITVPFALFGIQDYASRSANTSIAKVDGEDIDINIYYQELNSQQRNLQQQLGAAYTQEIDNTLKQTLLDSLINEKLEDAMEKVKKGKKITARFTHLELKEYEAEEIPHLDNNFDIYNSLQGDIDLEFNEITKPSLPPK